MKTFINTDERYGLAGPFTAESKQKLIDGMMPTFREWAMDAFQKTEDGFNGVESALTKEGFLAEAIAEMQDEFEAALEEIRSFK